MCTAANRAYLAMCLRHSAQIPLRDIAPFGRKLQVRSKRWARSPSKRKIEENYYR